MTFGGPAGPWELAKIIGIEAEYFEPNRERMRYPVFRAQSSALASHAPECFGPIAHRRADHPFKCRAPSHFHRALIAKKATIASMRRTLALLLMALFSFSLISPVVFASDRDSKLPACCRRGGKHHCAMMAMQSESPSGPSLQPGRCPLFPSAGAIPVGPAVSLPGFFQAIFSGLLTHSAVLPEAEALCLSSYSRAGQKRGPPASIS